MLAQRSLLAVVGIGACAAMIFNILPAFLGKAAESFALNDGEAGLLATVYLGGFGISSASAAFWLHRVNRRKMAGLSFVMAAALLAVGAWLNSYTGLIVSLGIAGLFLGVLYSLSFVLAGEFDDAVRAVGFKLGGEVALGALLIFLLPVFVFPVLGFSGMLAALAIILLVASPLALMVAPDNATESSLPSESSFTVGTFMPWAALLGLAALLAFTVGQSSLWTFVERAGVRAGYDDAAISLSLSTAVLMGGLGAFVAAIAGKRFGNSVPVVFAAVIYGLAVLALSMGQSFAIFAVGINLFFFIWLFTLPYFASGIAAADQSGKATALISACFAFGSMMGPVVAGTLVSGDDFSLLYIFCAALVLAALLALLGVLFKAASSETSHLSAGQ